MEKIKSFEEFIAENNSADAVDGQVAEKLEFDVVYESETGDVTVTANEEFVSNLQEHIAQTLKIVSEGSEEADISKILEDNFVAISTSFKNGETPEETAAKIAA